MSGLPSSHLPRVSFSANRPVLCSTKQTASSTSQGRQGENTHTQGSCQRHASLLDCCHQYPLFKVTRHTRHTQSITRRSSGLYWPGKSLTSLLFPMPDPHQHMKRDVGPRGGPGTRERQKSWDFPLWGGCAGLVCLLNAENAHPTPPVLPELRRREV